MTKEQLRDYVEQQEELYYSIMLSFEKNYDKNREKKTRKL